MPPWQCASGGGRSGSALSLASIPHEPWFLITLPVTVSYEPPAICTPVPTGGGGVATRRVRVVVRQDQVVLDDRAGSRGAAGAAAVLRRRRVVVVHRVRGQAGPIEQEHRVPDDQLPARVGARIPERGVDPGVAGERSIADPAARA